MPIVAVRREYQGSDGWKPLVQDHVHPTPEYEWRSCPHDRLHRGTDSVGALHRRLLLLQGRPAVRRVFLNRGVMHAESAVVGYSPHAHRRAGVRKAEMVVRSPASVDAGPFSRSPVERNTLIRSAKPRPSTSSAQPNDNAVDSEHHRNASNQPSRRAKCAAKKYRERHVDETVRSLQGAVTET
jgi:hypothetical protein